MHEIVNAVINFPKEKRPQLAIIHMDGEVLSGFDSQIHKIKIGVEPAAIEMFVQTKKGAFQ